MSEPALPEGFEEVGPATPDGFEDVPGSEQTSTPSTGDLPPVRPIPSIIARSEVPSSDRVDFTEGTQITSFADAPTSQPEQVQQDESKNGFISFEDRATTLKSIFDIAGKTDISDAQKALKIQNETGAPYADIIKNLDTFKDAWAFNENPKNFSKKNPRLTALILKHPELGTAVMSDRGVSGIIQAWEYVRGAGLVTLNSLASTTRGMQLLKKGDGGKSAAQYLQTADELIQEDIGATASAVNAPNKTIIQENERARRIREGGTLDIALQRFGESMLQMEASRLQYQVKAREDMGEDASDLYGQINDINKNSQPLNLGDESGALRALTDASGLAASTVSILPDVAEKGGVLGVAGAIVGGVGAFVIDQPELAPQMMYGGAQTMMEIGGTIGVWTGSRELSIGENYPKFKEYTTDSGRKFTQAEASAGSEIQGAFEATAEVFEAHWALSKFGPFKKFLTGSIESGLLSQMSNASLAGFSKQAISEWFWNSAKEGGTEALQSMSSDAVSYVMASNKDAGKSFAENGLGFFRPNAGAGQQRSVVNSGDASEAFAAAFVGSLITGVVGLTSNMTTRAWIARGAEKTGPAKLRVLMDMSKNSTIQAAPKIFAGHIAGDVTAVHVDARQMLRHFQEDLGLQPDAADHEIDKIVGKPGTSDEVRKLAVTGGKLEISAETVLKTYGQTDAATALVNDTVIDPAHRTAREQTAEYRAAEDKLIEEMVRERVTKAQNDGYIADIAREIIDARKGTKGFTEDVARKEAALFGKFYEQIAAETGATAHDAYRKYRINIGLGDNAPIEADGVLHLSTDPTEAIRIAAPTDAEGRAKVLHIDKLSGLLNRRGWNSTGAESGQTIVVTALPAKKINDAKNGGHESLNEFLRVAGRNLFAVDPQAARSGTNFLLRGDKDTLAKALAAVKEAFPAGSEIEGRIGPNTNAAFDMLDADVDKARKTVVNGVRQLPLRGESAFDTAKLDGIVHPEGRAQSQVTPEMIDQAGKMTHEEFIRAGYIDELGVLTPEGNEAAGPRKFTIALDGRGIKIGNEKIGREAGDMVILAVKKAAMAAGGKELAFTHRSGDEFEAKSNDKKELADFAANTWAALRKLGFNATLKVSEKDAQGNNIKEIHITPEFRAGIGESYGHADRDLNARKAAETGDVEQGIGGIPGARPRGEGRASVNPFWGRGNLAARNEATDAEGDVGRNRQGTDTGNDGGNQSGDRAEQSVRRSQEPSDSNGIPFGYYQKDSVNNFFNIFLNKKANKTTLLHEGGHAFFDILQEASKDPNASQRLKDLADDALKWAGGNNSNAHEKFARAFEAHLFKGKAPALSIERAMATFSRWLRGIYRNIKSIPGAQIDDEVRSVFDRMLATDDEIKDYYQERGLEEDAGDELPIERAQVDIINDRLKELQAIRSEVTKKNLKDAEIEYQSLPSVMATKMSERIPLNRKTVTDIVGEGAAAKFNLSDDGIQPDQLADIIMKQNGKNAFRDGGSMLHAMLLVPEEKKWAQDRAESKTQSAFDALTKQKKSALSKIDDRFRETVVKKIVRGISLAEKKTGRSIEPLGVLRRVSEIIAGLQPVREVDSGIQKAVSNQRKSSLEGKSFEAKGQWAKSLAAHKDALINTLLANELRIAQKEIAKFDSLAVRLASANGQSDLGKGAPRYRNAAGYILQRLGLMDMPEERVNQPSIESLLSIQEIEPVRSELLALLEKTPNPEDMTVKELKTIRDVLSVIKTSADISSQVMRGSKMVDLVFAEGEVVAAILEHSKAKPPLKGEASKTKWDKTVEAADRLSMKLLNPVDIFRDLSGDDFDSVLMKYFIDPMRDAKAVEADLINGSLKTITEAFDSIDDKTLALFQQPITPVLARQMFPNHIADYLPGKRIEIVMMAFNVLNPGNLQRLLDGRNITLEEVQAALNSLTKEEIGWVNTVTKAIESFQKPSFDQEEQLTGVRPEAIVGTSMKLRNGVLNGAYFPAVYERHSSLMTELAASRAASEVMDPTYIPSGTPHGFLKGRSDKVVAAISLNPASIMRHLHQAAHDIAFRQPLMSASRLLLQPNVQNALQSRIGAHRKGEILQWMKDVGAAQSASQHSVLSEIASGASRIMSSQLLGYNFPAALGDAANFGQVLAVTNLKTGHLAKGAVQYMSGFREAHKFALEKSKWMRSADGSIKKAYQKQVDRLTASKADRFFNHGFLGFYKDHQFDLMEASNHAVSTPIFLGAYHQGIAEGMGEEKAIRFADDVLSRVMPSHNVVDQAGILRDKNGVGAMVIFYSYQNTVYRSVRNIATSVQSGTISKADGLKRAMAVFFCMSIIGELLMLRGPESGDGDPEDGPNREAKKWARWVSRKMVLSPVDLLPGGFGSKFQSLALKKKANPLSTPAGFVVESLTKSMAVLIDRATSKEEKEFSASEIDSTIRILGIAPAFAGFGSIPVGPLIKQGRFAADVVSGKEAATPGNVISGALIGSRTGQPDNILRDTNGE